ncbi:MAG: hypothetical protein H6Q74_2750 [Firmicutes bacterium]|nr:hypothetical protein [Bacillota bacterium]
MGTYFTIKYTPEEADKWISYEDNAALGLTKNAEYDLLAETVDGSNVYYIINDNEIKTYDIWKKAQGDLVALF